MRKTIIALTVAALVVVLAGWFFLSPYVGKPQSARLERLAAQCRYRVSVAMLPYLDNPRSPAVAAALYDDCIKAKGEL